MDLSFWRYTPPHREIHKSWKPGPTVPSLSGTGVSQRINDVRIIRSQAVAYPFYIQYLDPKSKPYIHPHPIDMGLETTSSFPKAKT